MKKQQEEMGDLIYETLRADEVVEDNRAYIVDIVSEALCKAGYKSIRERDKEWMLRLAPYVLERPNTGKIRIIMDWDMWQLLKEKGLDGLNKRRER